MKRTQLSDVALACYLLGIAFMVYAVVMSTNSVSEHNNTNYIKANYTTVPTYLRAATLNVTRHDIAFSWRNESTNVSYEGYIDIHNGTVEYTGNMSYNLAARLLFDYWGNLTVARCMEVKI